MGFFSFFEKLFHKPVLPKSVDAVFFGLGNPGEYSETRHNVGFRVADALSQNLKNSTAGKNPESDFVSGVLDSSITVLVAKPRTFMNNSGRAVETIVKELKVPLGKILVIVDDINIPLGVLRARRGGSHGGHNGLKSIIAHVGPDFPRLRIGIGPPPKEGNLIDFVLGKFTMQEEAVLDQVIIKAVAASKLFISDGLDAVMNQYNK